MLLSALILVPLIGALIIGFYPGALSESVAFIGDRLCIRECRAHGGRGYPI